MEHITVAKLMWTDYDAPWSDRLTIELERNLEDFERKPSFRPVQKRSPARALIVDAPEQGTNILGFLLKKLQCTFEIVESVDEAISRLKFKNYKFVFVNTDLFGFDSAIALLNESVPVIGMNFEPTITDKLMSEKVGFQAFIRKSSLIDLVKAIGTCLKNSCGSASAADDANDSADILLAHMYVGELNFGDMLALFSGKVKILLSCMTIAVKERDCEQLSFLAGSLRDVCRELSLSSIGRAIEILLDNARQGKWSNVNSLMGVLATRFDLAIHDLLTISIPSEQTTNMMRQWLTSMVFESELLN